MQPIWSPSAERVADANVTRFIDCVNARRGLRPVRLRRAVSLVVEHPGEFWTRAGALRGCARAAGATGRPIENADRMPGARFFPTARLNFAENLLRFRDRQPAIVFRNERGTRRELSLSRAARGSRARRRRAEGRGRRYRAIASRASCRICPRRSIAMLATASLGAIWSSCSPDFGIARRARSLRADRAEGAVHGGWLFLRRQDARLARRDGAGGREDCRASSKVVVVGYVSAEPGSRRGSAASAQLAVRWSDVRHARRAARVRADCRSITRSTFSIRPAPRACRSASCTAPAARCFSIRRSICCTRTSSAPIASSTSRPAAG